MASKPAAGTRPSFLSPIPIPSIRWLSLVIPEAWHCFWPPSPARRRNSTLCRPPAFRGRYGDREEDECKHSRRKEHLPLPALPQKLAPARGLPITVQFAATEEN